LNEKPYIIDVKKKQAIQRTFTGGKDEIKSGEFSQKQPKFSVSIV
jgi:hypothetical protein